MKSGLGIRGELFEDVLSKKPDVGFFEAHSENYFGNSLSRAKLLELRQDYPVSLHGVGLSLGRADNLDKKHLMQLKHLIDEVEPFHVSEHLSWSAFEHIHLPDLLPLPLTDQSLHIILSHINEMQEVLCRQILIENPSNYLLFDQLQIPETEFLNMVADRTGCGLLVDINNISVSAQNLKRDPYSYIDSLDQRFIKQYHLAGYTEVEKDSEKVIVDTHNQTVYPEVWDLFSHTVGLHGKRPTLIEWDSDFPKLQVLLDECVKADEAIQDAKYTIDHLWPYEVINEAELTKHLHHSKEITVQQKEFLAQILDKTQQTHYAISDHQSRIWVYQNNVYGALIEYLMALFPALKGVVGEEYFRQMARMYLEESPPNEGNIHNYGINFYTVIKQFPALKEMPYIEDLMRYEWALHDAYYANDNSINVEKIDQEELATMALGFSEGVYLIDSLFPIESIYEQSLPNYKGSVAVNLQDGGQTLLVYRSGYDVLSKRLDSDEKIFFKTLLQEDSISGLLQSIEKMLDPNAQSKLLAFCFSNQILAKRLNENIVHQ